MASVLFGPGSYKSLLCGVYWVMDRKHLAVAVCIIVIVAFYFAFTWNKGGTGTSGQATVVRQGGSVTLVPGNNSWKAVVAADPGATNDHGKTSSPAVMPKGR
jgi:hypothetical protein